MTETALERIRRGMNYHDGAPRYTFEQSADIQLTSALSVISALRVDLAREKVARYSAEYNLASERLVRAQGELSKMLAESRGES